jgi:RimJ/RimL family protein N-acetyltransferase
MTHTTYELTLAEPRLRLHPVRRVDGPVLHALWTHADVRRFLFDDRVLAYDESMTFVERSLASFARHGYGLWLARDEPHDADQPSAFAGLMEADGAPPSLVVGVTPTRWRQGLASACARLVLQHAFDTLALDDVAADTDAPNLASQRLLDRLGFERGDDGPTGLLNYRLSRRRWRHLAQQRPMG